MTAVLPDAAPAKPKPTERRRQSRHAWKSLTDAERDAKRTARVERAEASAAAHDARRRALLQRQIVAAKHDVSVRKVDHDLTVLPRGVTVHRPRANNPNQCYNLLVHGDLSHAPTLAEAVARREALVARRAADAEAKRLMVDARVLGAKLASSCASPPPKRCAGDAAAAAAAPICLLQKLAWCPLLVAPLVSEQGKGADEPAGETVVEDAVLDAAKAAARAGTPLPYEPRVHRRVAMRAVVTRLHMWSFDGTAVRIVNKNGSLRKL
jgi:hypothetical protein